MRISDWSSDVCSSDLFILPILPKSKDIADGEPAEVHGRVVADPDLPSIGMALAGREIAVGAVEIILLSLVISGKLAIDQLRDSRNRTGIKPINQAATRLFVHFEIIKDSEDRKSTRLNSSH